MGKKGKVGKARKDHFYFLAKAQGLRARSAFKLLHLAQKLDLFRDVAYVLDLCAAPGGWMQVARKALPMTGHVFGVDLSPIKPIPGCTSLQADITTPQCRKLLDGALAEHGVPRRGVELVLHDGAPNVGSSWARDAYLQNELVLKALELAVRYLRPSGTFVTKIFRSQDFLALVQLLRELFETVHVVKPSSSRDVSAETFARRRCRAFAARMKLWVDEYAPQLFAELDLHTQQNFTLQRLLEQQLPSHVILSGSRGSGKLLRCRLLLQQLFGGANLQLRMESFVTQKKQTIELLNSAHTTELFASALGVDDKNIVQDVLRQYSAEANSRAFFGAARGPRFRVFVIHDADRLSLSAQASLRRTFEKA
uniref:AdoMet-dependent rRNA methyltransferase SPB1-like n=1 Tax=Dermatophagoides pteronyssinus TaxID=6956 RepID=A0A6P6XXF9_DERPT